MNTVVEAITLRRLLATSLISGSIAFELWVWKGVAHLLAEWGSMGRLGIPVWAIGALVFAVIMFLLMTEYATRLRLSLEPNFEIKFVPATCIAASLDRQITALPPIFIPVMGPAYQATYVRIELDAILKHSIKECVVGIIGLQVRAAGAANFVGQIVPQTILLHKEPLTLYPEIPTHIDFLAADQNENILHTTDNLNWPFILGTVFQNPGTYRFTFRAHAEGLTKTRIVDINRTGHWNAITGNEVA